MGARVALVFFMYMPAFRHRLKGAFSSWPVDPARHNIIYLKLRCVYRCIIYFDPSRNDTGMADQIVF